MIDFLRYDSASGIIRANRQDALESQGAAEAEVSRLLAMCATEFIFLREASYDDYEGQYNLLEDGDDVRDVDLNILPEDLDELVAIVNGTLDVPITDTDREIIEEFVNRRNLSEINQHFYQDYLPMSGVGAMK